MTLPTFWMAEQIFFSCISSNSLSFEDNSSEERCLASLSSVFLGEISKYWIFATLNCSLIALVGWLLVGLYYKAIPSDFKNIYIYGVSALFFVFTISISRSEVWNSFAIFIPFLIPLLVFFITISLQVVDYSKGLLFLCGLYLALYAHQIFLTTPIIFIPDIPLNDFFSILLVFLPNF